MAVRINVALRNKILDAIFNSGSAVSIFDNGTIQFRTGAQTATADDAKTGTVVATVALPADAMAAASAGSIAKQGTWQDLAADAAGTIGHAVFESQAGPGTYRMDVDVTQTGGGGTMTVDNPVLAVGQEFNVTAFSVTMPGT